MSKDEIVKLYDDKIKELDCPCVSDPRVEYCSEWLSKNKYVNADSFVDLDVFELIKYLLPIFMDLKDFETTEHMALVFDCFFSLSTPDDIVDFSKIAFKLADSGEIEKVVAMLNTDDEDEQNRILETITNLDHNFVMKILNYNPGIYADVDIFSDFADLLLMLDNYHEAFFNILLLIGAHKSCSNGYDLIDEVSEKYSNLNSKKKRKVLDDYKKKYFKFDSALSIANSILSFVNAKNSEYAKAERSRKIKIENYESSKKALLAALEKPEVVNARSIINGLDDKNLILSVLQMINDHNKIYHQSLKEELEKLGNNSETKYKALLHEYGIDVKNRNIRNIMCISIDDVRTILDIIIRKYNFDTDKTFQILEFSSLERVKLISSYILNGYLSIDFISNNIHLYDNDSKDLEVFNDNIEILKSFNVNPYIFKNSTMILFGNSTIINNNLQILNNYDLIKYFKTTEDFSFLLNNNLSSIIDKYLEYGFEQLLKTDLGILNFNNLKRLDIIHMLNIPIDSVDELNDILCSKRFIMEDSKIDSYIFNYLDYTDKKDFNVSFDDLEAYRCSSRCYSFDGVLVSVNKVKMLLQEGYNLYDSIFSCMNVNEDEYSRVVSCLEQKVY